MEKQKSTVAKTNMLFNKGFGQHILRNQDILNKIVEKSGINSTDIVLEIGPGTGNLTALLLEKAKKVICIEIDPRMIIQLNKRFGADYKDKFIIMKGDAIKTEFPFFNVCVANTPYQISSPLVFKLLAHRPVYKCAILMFQQEFAYRCVAKPGSDFYCRLSANISLLAKCDHIMKVGKNNFTPPPKVESSVVRFELRQPLPQINYKEWDALLRIAFLRKNKTLGALFKQKYQLQILEANYNRFMKNGGHAKQTIVATDVNLLGVMDEEQETNDKIEQMSKKEKRRMKEKNKIQENNNKNEMIDEDDDDDDDEVLQSSFKEKVVKILVDNGFEKLRSKSQSVDDYLKLLFVFNQENIHFF